MNSEITPKKRFYKLAPLSLVHLRIYLAIILGQFTCGYAIEISGTAVTEAQKYITIPDVWVGLIGAGTLIGLAGSLLVGKLSDKVGRRRLLMLNMYLLALISLGQLFTSNLLATFLMRVLVGLMIAVDYTAGNTLLIEWLPLKESGRFQSHLVIYWTLGFIAGYAASAFITGFGSMTWKLMMVSPAVFALITAVFRSVAKLPTSPSWLVNQGKPQAAQKVIRKNLGHKWGLSDKQKDAGKTADASFSWTVVFTRKYLRNTSVGGVFYAAQSFTFFGISIFLPILVGQMGITDTKMVGYLYNGSMLVGVLLGIVVFNRLSRRQFLIGDFALSAVCLLLLGFWRTMPTQLELVVFSLFSVLLSAGLVMDYPYTSELFDSSVRGTGVGMVVTFSRIGAAAGTFLLPIITTSMSVQMAMLICGALLSFAGLFSLLLAPETSRKHLARKAKSGAGVHNAPLQH